MEENEFKELFFETKFTMSILINLTGTKNRRFVILKPCILFTSNDEEIVKKIKNELQLQTNITETNKTKKRVNKRYNIMVQKFSEIHHIIEKFKGNIEGDRLIIFEKCFKEIENVGHINTSWDDRFEDIIDMKLKLNTNRKQFNKKQWIDKIKKHFDDL